MAMATSAWQRKSDGKTRDTEVGDRGRRHFSLRPSGRHPPATHSAYESDATRSVWYSSQHQHLAGWLSEYNGPVPTTARTPSTSSKHFYNHFRCAAGLVWLAEALGEDELVLRAGVEAIRGAGPNPSPQCAAFRRVVSWARIVELLALQPEEPQRDQALGQQIKSFMKRVRLRSSDGEPLGAGLVQRPASVRRSYRPGASN